MKKADIDEFYRCLSERNPDPQTELNWTTPYTLLVAVVLSAQATDIGVNKATKALFEIVDTRTMWVELDLPEDRLELVRTGQTVVIVLD